MTVIEQSYAPSRLYPKLSVLAMGLFLVGTNAFVIAGLLPAIAEDLGVHANEVSYSITFYSLVVAIGAPALSILLPRLSRTTLIVAGLVLFIVGGLVAASAQTLLAFMIGRIIAGVGGAAIVPTATAAAAAMAPPERRGSALSFVTIGFTLATAVGSPVGTLLGAAGGWRLPLYILVGLGAAVAVVVALTIRGVPVGAAASLVQRFAVLRNLGIVGPLLTAMLMVTGFNVVYIFSSTVAEPAIGDSGELLAVLLFSYGIAGVIGNAISGPLTDRYGNRLIAGFALGGQILVLALMPFLAWSLPALVALFVVWGISAFGATVPVQHRLVAVDPERGAIAMSWFTTAMYLGIALAPVLGAAASALGGATLIPIFGALATVIALLAFQSSFVARATR